MKKNNEKIICLVKEKYENHLIPLISIVTQVAKFVPAIGQQVDLLNKIANYTGGLIKKKFENCSISIQIDYEINKQLLSCIMDTFRFLEETHNSIENERFNELGKNLIGSINFEESINIKESDINNACERLVESCNLKATEKNKIVQCFYRAFQYCLIRYPELSLYILSGDIDNLKSCNKYIIELGNNEFLQKLRHWEFRDGMLQQLYHMFKRQFILEVPSTELVVRLSKIQDEYNEIFEVYNQVRHTRCVDTQMLINQVEDILHKENNVLTQIYIKFVIADYYYFSGRYVEAINSYKEIWQDYKNNYLSRAFGYYEIQGYLNNSIAWTYAEMNKNEEALAEYGSLFSDKYFTEYGKGRFSSAYRRNFGVVFERMRKYQEAIEQYEKALLDIQEESGEFKLYVTYCSCLMKHWDHVYGKLHIGWQTRIQAASNTSRNYDINHRTLDKMYAFLDLAQSLSPKFSDVYIQRVKVITYEILLCETNHEALFRSACRNLLLAEELSTNRKGFLFVKRDLYYALYLIDFQQKKNYWLDFCRQLNNTILENYKESDAEQFSKLISQYG